MDPKAIRLNLIQLLLQTRDYNTKTIEQLMADVFKAETYVLNGGDPAIEMRVLH